MSLIKTLTVVIPCYNEEKTLNDCVSRVLAISDESLQLEIIIIDDGSTDNSLEIANTIVSKNQCIRIFTHQNNKGKGAALRTGFEQATGDYVAIQDADLEYDPRDLKRLLEPLNAERADVVFGSRFHSTVIPRFYAPWHYSVNIFLTFVSNLLTDLKLTDMETCYKVFRREFIQELTLTEDRFGFEPEVVAAVARRRLRVHEVGISYSRRSYVEGKKIGIKDGFRALYCILRYNVYRLRLSSLR